MFLKSLMLMALPMMVSATVINSNIGKGISSFDQNAGLKDRCINLTQEEVFSEDVRATSYSLLLVKNKEELYDKISTSVSAEGSYGVFGAKAKASFVKKLNGTIIVIIFLLRRHELQQENQFQQKIFY